MNDHPLYNKVAGYCSRAERCPQEVRKWLTAREVDDADQESILQTLVEERYVDEARYIKAYASDKLRFDQRGPLRIKQELRGKELPERLIDPLVDEVMEENDYRQILEKLLINKLQAVDSSDPEVIQRNVIQWAYGKGFSFDDILAILSKLT